VTLAQLLIVLWLSPTLNRQGGQPSGQVDLGKFWQRWCVTPPALQRRLGVGQNWQLLSYFYSRRNATQDINQYNLNVFILAEKLRPCSSRSQVMNLCCAHAPHLDTWLACSRHRLLDPKLPSPNHCPKFHIAGPFHFISIAQHPFICRPLARFAFFLPSK